MFYTFNQNNSGGVFRHDPIKGVGYAVSIEAVNAQQANAKAEEIGIYFNGCGNGIDCDCCGDRWYRADELDAEETPTLYGAPLTGGWGYPSYIHYLNGKVEIRAEESK